MERPVRGLEHAMIASGEEMGPLLGIARLTGRIPESAVAVGLSRVRARHPALRTALRDGRWVVQDDPGAVSLFVRAPAPIPGDPRAAWERVAEAELRWPIDLGSGVPIRVVMVPEPGATTVILAVHPALVDAASLGRVLHETLCATAEAMGGPEVSLPLLPPPPSLLETLPVPAPVRWLSPVLRRLWLGDVRAQQQDPVLPPEGVGVHRSLCAFRRGSSRGLRRLAVAADEHGVSVADALVAAVTCSLLRSGAREQVQLDLAVDLRSRAAIPGEAVGAWSGPVRLTAQARSSFWELARSGKSQAQSLVAWGLPLLAHAVADGLDPRQALDDAGIPSHRPGAPPLLCALAPWREGTSYGPFALREVYTLHGMVPRSAPLGLWLREMPDGLCLGASAAGPALSRTRLEKVLDDVLALCEAPPSAEATVQRLMQRGSTQRERVRR